MYKIIGSDGREYGPVDATMLRTWIAEGRLNGETRACAEGTSEWKRLADFPEFADPFAPRPQPQEQPVVPPIPQIPQAPEAPYASAGGGAQDPQSIAAAVLGRGGRVDIGTCFSRAFDVLKEQPGTVIGSMAVVMVVLLVLGFIPIVGMLAGIVINGPLIAGLMSVLLKCMRRQPATITDVFAGFGPRFVPLLLASVVMSVLVGAGLLLCIVPGIFLAICWLFTFPLIIDRGFDFWPAMETSRNVVTPQWFMVFLLQLLAGLVSAAGLLACGIGVVATAPLGVMAMLFAYEDIFGGQGA